MVFNNPLHNGTSTLTSSYFYVDLIIKLIIDANIYIQKDNTNDFLILTIYVDDCILVCNKTSLIEHLKYTLQKDFDLSSDVEIH